MVVYAPGTKNAAVAADATFWHPYSNCTFIYLISQEGVKDHRIAVDINGEATEVSANPWTAIDAYDKIKNDPMLS